MGTLHNLSRRSLFSVRTVETGRDSSAYDTLYAVFHSAGWHVILNFKNPLGQNVYILLDLKGWSTQKWKLCYHLLSYHSKPVWLSSVGDNRRCFEECWKLFIFSSHQHPLYGKNKTKKQWKLVGTINVSLSLFFFKISYLCLMSAYRFGTTWLWVYPFKGFPI